MASASESLWELNLQAHMGSQLRFILGKLARLDASSSNRVLTLYESRELSFCARMLSAVRGFKNANMHLENAKLFWEAHDILRVVSEKNDRVEQEHAAGGAETGCRWRRPARKATNAPGAAPRKTAAGADGAEQTHRELTARFQSLSPCHEHPGSLCKLATSGIRVARRRGLS